MHQCSASDFCALAEVLMWGEVQLYCQYTIQSNGMLHISGRNNENKKFSSKTQKIILKVVTSFLSTSEWSNYYLAEIVFRLFNSNLGIIWLLTHNGSSSSVNSKAFSVSRLSSSTNCLRSLRLSSSSSLRNTHESVVCTQQKDIQYIPVAKTNGEAA